MAHKAICWEVRVFKATLDCSSHHSQLSQREENCFQGFPLHKERSSDRTLEQRAFFRSLASNLEKRMLSQGKDQTGYKKLLNDLKMLYLQYWPEDVGALFAEDELVSLCQQFGIDGPWNVIQAYREYQDNDWEFIQDGLKDLLAVVNTVPISTAQCEGLFSDELNLHHQQVISHPTSPCYSFFALLDPLLTQFNPIANVRSWITKGHNCLRP